MKKLNYIFIILLFVFISCNHNVQTTFTVTYISELGDVPDSITVNKGDYLLGETLPILTAEHAEFKAWLYGEEEVSAGTFVVTEDITLVAKWIYEQCYVSFNSDIEGVEPYLIKVDYGKTIKLPVCPFEEPSGMKFTGWTINETKSSVFMENEDYLINQKEVFFTAVWIEKDSYSIVYRNVEQEELDALQIKNPLTYKETSDIRLYSINRTGYIFNGWYENEECSGTPVTSWSANTKKGNVILYASFTPITYYIQYYVCNDDEYYSLVAGSMGKQKITYDTEELLTKNEFAVDGMKFYCWTTNPDDKPLQLNNESVIHYSDEQSVKNLSAVDGSVIKLYAMFAEAVAPDTPTDFRVYKRTHNSLELKWINPTDNDLDKVVLKYKVSNSSEEEKIIELTKKEETYILNNLSQNTNYVMRLVAVDKVKNESVPTTNIIESTRFKNGATQITNLTRTCKDMDYTSQVSVESFKWNNPGKDSCPDFDTISLSCYYFDSLGTKQIIYDDTLPSIGNKAFTIDSEKNLKCGQLYTIEWIIREKKDESGFDNASTFKQTYLASIPIVTDFNIESEEVGLNITWKNSSFPVQKVIVHYENEKGEKGKVEYSSAEDIKTSTTINKTITGLNPFYKYTLCVEPYYEVTSDNITYKTNPPNYENDKKSEYPYFNDGIHGRIGYIYYTDGTCYHCNKVEKTPHGVVYATTEDLKPKKIVSFILQKKSSSNQMSYWYDASWDGLCYDDESFSCPDLEELSSIYNMRDILNNSNVIAINNGDNVIPGAQYAVIVSSTLYNNYRYFIREDNGRAISDFANAYSSNGSTNARGYKETFPDNYRSSVTTAYAIFVKDVSQN